MGLFAKTLKLLGYVPTPKASPTAVADTARYYQQREGIPLPHRADAYADAYKKQWTVYACVSHIAESVARIPIRTSMRQRDGSLARVDDHPAAQLLRFVNPMRDSSAALWEAWVGNLCLQGNNFWAYVLNRAKYPAEIWTVRPDRMRVKPDGETGIGGYIYTVNDRQVSWPPEEVLHWRRWNPTNDYYGLGPLAAAELSAAAQLNAATWNSSIFDNYGAPSGQVTTDVPLVSEEIETYKKAWDDTFAGPANQHKVIWMGGGLRFEKFGLTPAEMEFQAMLKMSREEICATFKVPPAIAGLFEYANYANAEAQLRMYWELCVLAWLDFRVTTLSELYGPIWDDRLVFTNDLSNVPTLIAAQAEQITSLRNAVDGGLLVRDEAREILSRSGVLDLPPYDDEDLGRGFWAPFTLAPVARSDGTKPEAALAPASSEEPLERPSEPPPKSAEGYRFRLSPEQRRAKWAVFDKSLLREQRRFADGVRKLFRDLGGDVDPAKSDDPFDLKKWRGIFRDEGIKLIRKPFAIAGQNELEDLDHLMAGKTIGMKANFNADNRRSREFLAKRAQRFAHEVPETIWGRLRGSLQEGMAAGDSVAMQAQRVQDTMAAHIRSSPEVIARTEVIGAHNGGAFEAYQQVNDELGETVISKKEWIATMDDQTRETHAEADGQIVALEDDFEVGDELLAFPGDSGGDAGEVVNCRCTVAPIVE